MSDTIAALYRQHSRRCVQHAGAPARQLRPGRGGAARRLPGRRRALAGAGRAGQPGGVAGVGRALQGHRPAAAGPPLHCLGRCPDRDPGRHRARPGTTGRGGRRDRRRPPAPGVHLLPPQPVGGGAHRPDAARGLRPHHRGHCRRLPGAGAHAGAAHRAGQGQDRRRPHPLRGAGSGRIAGASGQRAARGVPGVQRGACRAGRPPGGRGHPPGAAAAATAAAPAAGRGPAACWPCCC